MTKKVVIASKNPVKINAVKTGFEKMFPEEVFEFDGISVSSEVKDQPSDNKETLNGAKNRARNAQLQVQEADYWVGIEGGIEKVDDEMQTFAWVVIISDKKIGRAKTGTFVLPKKYGVLIEEGKELGEANDIVFGNINSKQKNGAVGSLTENVIVRTSFNADAVVLALIPFKNSELY